MATQTTRPMLAPARGPALRPVSRAAPASPARARSPVPDEACACGGGCPRCSDSPRHRLARIESWPPDRPGPAAVEAIGAAGIMGPGRPLDAALRQHFEQRFDTDLGHVRLHTDRAARRSAAALRAQAYTIGPRIAFGSGAADTGTLLGHELAHVVQQTRRPHGATGSGASHEAEAELAARVPAPRAPRLSAAAPGVQRRIEMRDVGRGEFSGFARLPELVDRLNAISPSLLFDVVDGVLTYEQVAGLETDEFDRQMMGFIDSASVIPMRLTNRHGLLGDRIGGFNEPVFEDAWASGYVDIDDLLASSDLGLQSVLVHFLQERLSTRNYARRIGSPSMDFAQPGVQAEFDRVHARGIEAEVQLLRDFFGDPSIRHVPGAEGGSIARVYRNDRRDRIRTRVRSGRGTAESGVHAVFIDVRLRDGTVMSAEDYRALLEREREAEATRAQVERERLGGAAEHRAGGGAVPAP